MENYQRFAEKEIKDKLLKIGNSKLAEIANGYVSMESIASAIARSGAAEDFAINYFKKNSEKNLEYDVIANLKDSERNSIVNLILAYKSSPTAAEAVIKDVFMTLMYRPDDIGNLVDCLNLGITKDVLKKHKGEDLRTAMQCLGEVARYTKSIENVKKVADSICKCEGSNLKKYAETIGTRVLLGIK